MLNMPVRVAAVQFSPAFGQKEANLRRLAPLVIQAAEGGAKLIVLPELAVVGYSFMSKAEADKVAEYVTPKDGRSGRTFEVMAALAKKLGVVIVFGLVEKDAGTGELHNAQVLVTPGGKYISYRKVNSFGQDFIWSTPGRSNPPVLKLSFKDEAGETHTKKVGLLICRDVRDKKDSSWDSFYEKGDADIVCFSANWGRGGFPANAWMEFAENNACTLIVANRYGTEANNDFGEGGICVIKKDQTVLCDGLVWGQDCIVYGEV
jgi:predicted amidohydrolase